MNWFQRTFSRRRFRSELSEEIRAHLDEMTEELVASGLPPDEARAAARRQFGNVSLVEEDSRQVWRWPRIEDFVIDVRYGLRMLLKNPGFTVVAVLTLALGIGANTAMFSFAEAAWLRPWSGESPQQLAKILATTPQGPDGMFSFPDYQDLSAQVSAFEGIAAWSRHMKTLRIGADSQYVLDDLVSPNYFSILRVSPQLGRAFATDLVGNTPPVVIISDSLWKRAFHADPALVGKPVWLTGQSYTVIGIAPPHFHGLEPGVPTDLWLPATTEYASSELADRGDRDFELLARVRSGVSAGQARTELQTIGRRLAHTYPAVDKARDLALVTQPERLRDALVPVFLLMASVGLVMLICCANVAGLLLARAETRRSEVAVRLALGAGRLRLLRQLLTESFLLTASSALLGLLFAEWSFTLQPAFLPPSEFPLGLDLRLNPRVVAFTVLMSLVTVLVIGLVPALQALKPSLVPALKGDVSRGLASARRIALRDVLVVGEIALAVVLLTASGLLVRSLLSSHSIDLGFSTRKSLVFFDLVPGIAGYDAERSSALFAAAADQTTRLPGVIRSAFARRVLLSDSGGGATLPVAIPGITLPQGQQNIPIKFNAVGVGYFQTVGTRLLAGRAFSPADDSLSGSVVIISQAMSSQFWPGQDAIGRHILAAGKHRQIIGIVENAKINRIHEAPEPYMYLPFAQAPSTEGTLIVETAADTRPLVASVRNRLRDLDPNVPVTVRTLRYLMRQAFWEDQMAANFVVALALLGIFLGAVGLYAVIAFTVNQRRHEIGIRMALGAGYRNVLGMVMLQGLKLAASAAAIGLLASLVATRLLASALYGIKPTDPISFAASITLVFLVALLACYIPARRATRVDPMVALRYE
ncbi:MAG TPA: ABC transporter permease [Candidatus Saccharimonadales bacterium]|nr:ABC transporter permease [Candidatus Saccharimonadales bacterium]